MQRNQMSTLYILQTMVVAFLAFMLGYTYRIVREFFNSVDFDLRNPNYQQPVAQQTQPSVYRSSYNYFNPIQIFMKGVRDSKKYDNPKGKKFVDDVIDALHASLKSMSLYTTSNLSQQEKVKLCEIFDVKIDALEKLARESEQEDENYFLRYYYIKRLLANILFIDSKKKYAVVGYGSLLSPRSAARTIKNAINVAHVNVQGWERVFNLYHNVFDGNVLNVRKSPLSKINVSLIEIDAHDLAQFFIRESSYDFACINLSDMEFAYDAPKKPFEATFAYMCVSRYDVRKQPLEHYLKTCMYSCKQVSEQALQLFCDSTVVYHLGEEMSVRKYLNTVYGDNGIQIFSENDGGY